MRPKSSKNNGTNLLPLRQKGSEWLKYNPIINRVQKNQSRTGPKSCLSRLLSTQERKTSCALNKKILSNSIICNYSSISASSNATSSCSTPKAPDCKFLPTSAIFAALFKSAGRSRKSISRSFSK